MANALINLLDLTKLTGSDSAVGLLEETLTYAPELSTISGRTISGTLYKTSHRTLPTAAFRQANNGSDTVKSAYRQRQGECFVVDVQLQMDKAVADAQAAQTAIAGQQTSLESVLFLEAQSAFMSVYNLIGAQTWYGTTNDTNGFSGILALTNALNTTISATATTPFCISAGGSASNVQTSAYLIWESVQGVHYVWGNNQGFNVMDGWRVQQVNGANSKPLTGYVNNIQGWIGLAVNHPLAVARISNIDATHPLTDKLVAQLLQYIPLQMQGSIVAGQNGTAPTWGGRLRLFMNPQARFTLQNSRSVASTAITAADPLKYSPTPVETNGVPITVTNSITNTEAVVS